MAPRGDPTNGRPSARAAALLAGLVVAALVALLFHEALFGGEVLSQADFLLLHEPWRSVAPADFQAGNPSLSDQAGQFQPWMLLLRERLSGGGLPLWNERAGAGAPLLANLQSAVLSPFTWAALLLPFGAGLLLAAVLKLLIAGGGAALFARRLGCSLPACTLAAVAFAFGGFVMLWLGHPHSSAACLLPLLLYLADVWVGGATAAEAESSRSAPRPPARPWWTGPAIALSVATLLLAGHIETALHVSLTVALWAVLRSGGRPLAARLSMLAWLGLWAVIGVAISGAQLLPFIEYLHLSDIYRKRLALAPVGRRIPWEQAPWLLGAAMLAAGAVAAARRAVKAAEAAARAGGPGPGAALLRVGAFTVVSAGLAALGLALLSTLGLSPLHRLLYFPDAFGHPVPAFGMPYAGPRAYVNVNNGYAGLITLPLALFAVCCAPAGRPGRRPLLLLWLLAFVLAFDVPLISQILNRLPLLDLSLNYRMSLVVGFAGAMLAAMGLDALTRPAQRARSVAGFWVALLVLAGALVLAPRVPLQRWLGGAIPENPPAWAIDDLAAAVGAAGEEPAGSDAAAPALPAGALLPTVQPVRAGEPLHLQGWALGRDGPALVEVELAQGATLSVLRVLPDRAPSPWRPPRALLGRPGAERCGFALDADLSAFEGGDVRLRFSLLQPGGAEGERVLIAQRTVRHLPSYPPAPRWPLLAAASALLLIWGSVRASAVLPLAAAAVLAADMLAFARGFNPSAPPEHLFPPTRVTDFLRERLAAPGAGRIWAIGADVLMANTASVYGLSDTRNYDALGVERLELFLQALAPAGRPAAPGETLDVSHPLFALLDVAYILAPASWTPPPGSALQPVLSEGELTVFENRAPRARAFVADAASFGHYLDAAVASKGNEDGPPELMWRRYALNALRALAVVYRDPRRLGTLAIEGDAPLMGADGRAAGLPPDVPVTGEATLSSWKPQAQEWQVRSSGPGWLFVGDTFFPGWRATVNGQDVPIVPAFLAFRAVSVPAGESQVSFRYEPPSFRHGLLLTGAGLLAVVVMGAAAWRRRMAAATTTSTEPRA